MPVEHVSLSRCRVLYLGSAIPLETAVGIESLQAPCRDRYVNNVDSSQKASGIDSIVSVYSSGLMLQYASDQASSTWFPIQTLHVCAAVKAVPGSGPLRFVSLDTAAAQRSSNPPMFACIMRRTKGIKVLECHVFICKSNQAAMSLVQSCTHAFQHKEGWLSSMPSTGTRIVSAEDGYKGGKSTVRSGGFYSDRSDLVQKFDVSCRLDDQPASNPPQSNTLAIIASNSGTGAPSSCGCSAKTCNHCPAQTPAPAQRPMGQQMMMPVIPMNPPGAPVPMAGMGGYFADWNSYGGQPMMFVPNSPFYPGAAEMEEMKKKRKKKKAKKSKKNSCSDDEEEETYFVKKSDLLNHRGDSLRAKMRSTPGDSLRSRLRGHGRSGVVIEEIIQPPRPCPPNQPPVVIAPQRPCPPQIILVPQPQPPVQPQQPAQPAAPADGPSFKNQQNPKTDVVVYAPQVITANRKTASFNYDDRDNEAIDYHPDSRRSYNNNERQLYDGRQDNRVDYRQGYYRTDDYRADQRRFDNREDNRRMDYRNDQYSNREDNRRLDYRADNRSNRMVSKSAATYGGEVYGGDMYEPGYVEDGGWEAGYNDAQIQDYNAQVEDYNRQMAQYYDEEDDGYCADDYCMQPGYTDDYGVADYVRYAPEPQGRYELDYVDDYVVDYGQRASVPAAGNQGFTQVANGLGYYP